MKLLKKMAIAGLFGFASLFFLVSVSTMFDRTTPAAEKNSQFWGGLALGLPSAGLGLWLVRGLQAEERRKKEQALESTEARLRQALFEQIQAGEGEVTLLKLTMASNLPTEVVREFLDRAAIEFNASFDPSPEGSILYRFPK